MTEAIGQDGKSALATRLAPLARFVVVGAVNTLFSIAVYQAVLYITGHIVAYIVAYAAGTLFAYIAYARHVFGAGLAKKQFVLFALFYIASGCAGTLLNALLIEQLTLHARAAVFVTVILMLPLNYLGSKWCLRGNTERRP